MDAHNEIVETFSELMGIDESLRTDILSGSHEWLASYTTIVSEIDNRLARKNPNRIISGLLLDELKYGKTQQLQAAAIDIHDAMEAHSGLDASTWRSLQGAIGHDWFYAALIVRVYGDRLPPPCSKYLAEQVNGIRPFVRRVVTTKTPLDPNEMWLPVKNFQHALERIREKPELGVTGKDVKYAKKQLNSIVKFLPPET